MIGINQNISRFSGGFNPASLALSGWWRANFTDPWLPTVSAGSSGANGTLTDSAPSTGGTYASGVPYRGTNQAGAEFGSTWTGWNGQTFYIFPTTIGWANELTYLASIGINAIRIPFAWERMQHTLNGALDATYKTSYVNMVQQATNAGFRVTVDCHNYARYATGAWSGSSQVNTYTQHLLNDGTLTFSHLADLWTKVATLFAAYPANLIDYDIMNEPHDLNMTSGTWYAGMQTVINAIRTVDMIHTIGVPNTQGSDIYHFTVYSPGPGTVTDAVASLAVTDSANNLQFIGHAYQENANEWGSAFTNYVNWAVTHSKKIVLNEIGIQKTTGSGASIVSTFLTSCNAASAVLQCWNVWGIDPYGITDNTTYTTPSTVEPWFAPFFITGTVNGFTPAPSQNGFTPAAFDGAIQYLFGANTASTYLSNAASSIWVLAYVDSTSATSGLPTTDVNLMSENGGDFCMSISSSGYVATINDGGYKSTSAISFSTGAYHLFQMSWNSTEVWARVDNGVAQTVSAGANDFLGNFNIGINYATGTFLSGRILEVGTAQKLLTPAQFDQVRIYCNTRYRVNV